MNEQRLEQVKKVLTRPIDFGYTFKRLSDNFAIKLAAEINKRVEAKS
jgi:hypothetical protein